MGLISAAITGNYAPVGNPENANCVIAQTFGNGGLSHAGEVTPGDVNEALAQYIIDSNYDHRQYGQLLLQAEVAAPYQGFTEREVDHVLGRKDAYDPDQYIDSWQVLREAVDFMDTRASIIRPIIVAHARHVGRIAAQLRKMDGTVEPIIPTGLPALHDPRSTQSWTRSKRRWAMRELPGLFVLRKQGKL